MDRNYKRNTTLEDIACSQAKWCTMKHDRQNDIRKVQDQYSDGKSYLHGDKC